jgi:hypothetical protein
MSLTRFVKLADVKAKLQCIRPKLPRKIDVPIKAAPRTLDYPLVGTAFDYVMRFELQRRAPHAISTQLIAESAPDLILRPGFVNSLTARSGPATPEQAEAVAKKEVERVRSTVQKAKEAIAAYLVMQEPTRSNRVELACHAISLAKLDVLCRAGQFNPSFQEADPEDVEDLLALLEIVPFDTLIHPQIMLLNPNFGETSALVGEADADLITGDMLVDFKTTKGGETQVGYLDQIFGYYLLSRHRRQTDPTFPILNRLAIYFCRHGHLWSLDTTAWTEHPLFAETEEWFFRRAREVFSSENGSSPVESPTD